MYKDEQFSWARACIWNLQYWASTEKSYQVVEIKDYGLICYLLFIISYYSISYNIVRSIKFELQFMFIFLSKKLEYIYCVNYF